MAAAMVRQSREVWIERVRQWRESGQTAKEFAAEVGIKHNTLTHWAWSLKKQEQEAQRSADADVSFVEVQAGPADGGPLEVVLAGHRRILVPNEFDRDALVRLVGALESCR